jgi:RNA polymerase sigma factor (sigma-70 family)
LSAGSPFAILIEQVRQGSEEAARELYERYGPLLVQVVRRQLSKQLRPKYDSQDFTQAVWASFFALPAQDCNFASPEALVAFLTRMARNKVTSAVRQRLITTKYNVNREQSLNGSAAFLLADQPAPLPRPSECVAAEDTWERLLAAAPEPRRRILIMLRQGKSHREIAAVMGIDEKTIRRLLERLRTNLALP